MIIGIHNKIPLVVVIMTICTRCGADKQIKKEAELINVDMRTHERSSISIKLCEDCLNGLCFCDVCLEKTTYESYKDHLNLHEKGELIDLLLKFKLNAERNIIDF